MQLLVADCKITPSVMGSRLAKYLVESAVAYRHDRLSFLCEFDPTPECEKREFGSVSLVKPIVLSEQTQPRRCTTKSEAFGS